MRVETVHDVGSAVRAARRALGMTQSDLAARAGVSREWVLRLEKGHPRLEAQAVLDALRAVGLMVELEPRPTPEERRSTDSESKPLKMLDHLDEVRSAADVARTARDRRVSAARADAARRVRDAEDALTKRLAARTEAMKARSLRNTEAAREAARGSRLPGEVDGPFADVFEGLTFQPRSRRAGDPGAGDLGDEND